MINFTHPVFFGILCLEAIQRLGHPKEGDET
jgi:hypothetical protein